MDPSAHDRCGHCGARVDRTAEAHVCTAPGATARARDSQVAQVPRDFWRAPAMVSALHSRNIGRVIRAFRTHEFFGDSPLKQAEVAEWLGLSQAQLSKIETGPPIVHLDRLTAWAAFFGIPQEHLWFSLPPATAPGSADIVARPVPALWSIPTADAVTEYTREDLSLDRRTATKTIVGMVLGPALLEPLERWLYGPDESDNTMTRTPLRIGTEEIAQMEAAARLFREWDDRFGGGLRRKAVIGQLNDVADLVRDVGSRDHRRRLYGVMGQLAETAAIMSWDTGRQSAAQHYYALALRSSQAAGDVLFSANVLAGMARQLLYLGHASDALELVRLAQDRTRGIATPNVESLLYTREAWAYAAQGRITAFRRATERGAERVADSDPAGDPFWLEYYGLSEFYGTTGGRFLELAHRDATLAPEATGYIERAIELRGDGHLRSSALDVLGLAESRLIQGEPEESARLGLDALTVVEQTPSMRVRVKLSELYEYTRAHQSVRAITEFRDSVRPLLAQSSAAND